MKYKAVTLGLVLAGTALGSAALTLGRARGAAWIGQPLELVVPLQIDAGEAAGGLCPEADVFHGDSRQDSSRIQVQASAAEQPNTFNLRIRSTALIDEPVVSVYLRVGCTQKSSRKYVLLADFPSDIAPVTARVAAPQEPQVPLVVPVSTPISAPLAPSGPVVLPVEVPAASANVPAAVETPAAPAKQEAPVASNGVATPAKEVAKEAAVPPPVAQTAKPRPAKREEKPEAPKAAKPAAPKAAAKTESAGKPRLRLDPIETLSERVTTLEATTVATSLQEDLARDSERMQKLQTDLRSLLDQAVKNEAALAAMRERLEKAEAERVPVSVVYGLLALVVLAMGALAFLWTKRPKQLVADNQSHPGQPSYEPPSPRAVAPAKDIDIDL